MASIKKRPNYQIINGMYVPGVFSPKCVKEAFEYKARPDDVIISTYPKCGTTWMQSVLIHMFRKGKALDSSGDFLKSSPFIDMVGVEGVTRMPRPGAIKTHLPFNFMPYSTDTKYVYVARNPLDACVSFYHHTRMHPGFAFWDGEFDDFFECFMAGEVEYNDYFDHLLSWYPHWNDKNVFFTTFETMKKDLRSVVLKLADFLGDEYAQAIQKDNAVLENVLKYSSFDYMKSRFSEIYDIRTYDVNSDLPEGFRHLMGEIKSLNPPENLPKQEFIRKGQTKGWKNYFSDEQYKRLKEKYQQKLAGTDIPNLWPDLFL